MLPKAIAVEGNSFVIGASAISNLTLKLTATIIIIDIPGPASVDLFVVL